MSIPLWVRRAWPMSNSLTSTRWNMRVRRKLNGINSCTVRENLFTLMGLNDSTLQDCMSPRCNVWQQGLEFLRRLEKGHYSGIFKESNDWCPEFNWFFTPFLNIQVNMQAWEGGFLAVLFGSNASCQPALIMGGRERTFHTNVIIRTINSQTRILNTLQLFE